MRHRRPVNKRKSVGKFRGRAAKSHALNFVQPMRGGIRL